jgi:8-oxo-dGTP pyrophosphatase MutT (NUDIX family)
MAPQLRRTLSGGQLETGIVNAVGVWFFSTSTKRYLYLLRNDPKHPPSWGLPGGKVETGETLLDAINRECDEELGSVPAYLKLIPIEQFTSTDQKFCYHTFFATVVNEFVPALNHEHLGYAWIDSTTWPRPLHPGLWSTVNFEAVLEKLNTIKQLS